MQPTDSVNRRLQLRICGRVQGVGFRWFVQQTAESLGIEGWVRNLPDGSVEAQAQGSGQSLSRFVAELKSGHPHAKVESVESEEMLPQSLERRFFIR